MAVVATAYGPPLAATQDVFFYRQVGTSPIERWYIGSAAGAVTTGVLAISTANQFYATPFVSTRGGTLDRLAINVTTPSATNSANCRLGIYTATSNTNIYPSTLLVDGGTINLSNSGANTTTISQPLTANTLYWLCLITSVTDAVISSVTGSLPVLGYPNTLSGAAGTGLAVAQAFGTLPSTFPASATILTSSAFTPAIYVRYSA